MLRAIRWKWYLKKGSINSKIILMLYQRPDKKASSGKIAEYTGTGKKRLQGILPVLKRRGLLDVEYDGRQAIYSLTREGRWLYLTLELGVPFISLIALAVLYCYHKKLTNDAVRNPPYWYPDFINHRVNQKYCLYSSKYLETALMHLVRRGYVNRIRDHIVCINEATFRYLSRFDCEFSELLEWSDTFGNDVDRYLDQDPLYRNRVAEEEAGAGEENGKYGKHLPETDDRYFPPS